MAARRGPSASCARVTIRAPASVAKTRARPFGHGAAPGALPTPCRHATFAPDAAAVAPAANSPAAAGRGTGSPSDSSPTHGEAQAAATRTTRTTTPQCGPRRSVPCATQYAPKNAPATAGPPTPVCGTATPPIRHNMSTAHQTTAGNEANAATIPSHFAYAPRTSRGRRPRDCALISIRRYYLVFKGTIPKTVLCNSRALRRTAGAAGALFKIWRSVRPTTPFQSVPA